MQVIGGAQEGSWEQKNDEKIFFPEPPPKAFLGTFGGFLMIFGNFWKISTPGPQAQACCTARVLMRKSAKYTKNDEKTWKNEVSRIAPKQCLMMFYDDFTCF
jgi:hypothetical protein